jgi:hypothetical protein
VTQDGRNVRCQAAVIAQKEKAIEPVSDASACTSTLKANGINKRMSPTWIRIAGNQIAQKFEFDDENLEQPVRSHNLLDKNGSSD